MNPKGPILGVITLIYHRRRYFGELSIHVIDQDFLKVVLQIYSIVLIVGTQIDITSNPMSSLPWSSP